ncbi:MAG: outer membrane lipoprotein-sorting protein [candidate division Zixibacteria bacterium]|nr:outer membrane lipoprotein-sorting protein [candidate division Zixibacteria bacterium]
MKTAQWLTLATLFIALGGNIRAQAADDIDVDSVIHHIDQMYRSTSSIAEFEMEIVTPNWQRTMAMYAWSIGMDKTLIRITAPKKDNGVATLRLGNEMWNYLPKTNKVMKIPPSMMMSSWMGSDFTNDDLVKEFSLFEDFTYEVITVEDAADSLIYINSIPREDLPIVWGNIITAATRKDWMPVWQRYYDEDGKLMRVLQYSEITTFDGRRLPAVMTMTPMSKEGHRTVIRYKQLEFDREIPDDIFSLRNLRSQTGN